MKENEGFLVESSSGSEKENVNHSLDGTIKLLAECNNSLLYIFKRNKKASIDNILKKCTLSALSKSGKWKAIEVRSSRTPTSWDLRRHWKSLFKMMAIIYDELLEQRKLDNIIIDEVCSSTILPSKSVINHFLNVNV
ncbi:hypothetical protein BDF21DRAFT_396367 [Thamnidium elegans]|nr:hypothetical protein BDF21DRAFT_396367 [Thamnidium elegans]